MEMSKSRNDMIFTFDLGNGLRNRTNHSNIFRFDEACINSENCFFFVGIRMDLARDLMKYSTTK